MDLQRLKPHFPWITLLVLILGVGLYDPGFLKPENLLLLAGDIVPLFIMALGLTFAIYIGGIDLSAQSMANLITVVATVYLASLGFGVAILCLLVGVGLGALSGFVTTRLFVPSFISTLAVGGICISAAQWLSGNRGLNMDADQRNAIFGWMIGKTWIIPNELFIAAALLLFCLFIERRTTLGRALKAVGAGEMAAAASGLNVARYKILAFAISGGLAAVGGLSVLDQAFGWRTGHRERISSARHRCCAGGGNAADWRGWRRGQHGNRDNDRRRHPRLDALSRGRSDAAADGFRAGPDRGHRADHRPLQASHGEVRAPWTRCAQPFWWNRSGSMSGLSRFRPSDGMRC